ncbi:MAG: phenylalanine--tRNA ligase subunit beta [Ignavibacteriales bacterium UTCHB2]|jgi:phenylalanyl-tRNA synthetase beta chain|nr:MAG: Phenylalanine--tRNA ligase beta subunit [Ignavibacteria bacterium ADurb.Bin266]OQY75323.1 MAG: phenylalanine--tRNA ligase subunit beta [Ignavibacteriales bacterium UTCHB2]HQI41775.1 phenylalanine--tRNA ligase subunit beta [Ignavibacteriaceae bacterium]
MKVLLSWIKELVNLDGITTDEIVSRLTMSGLEVEDVIDQSNLYKDFIVGFVKETEKHPNADKLTICKVFDGKEDLQVICGAPNVKAGQKVVFAPIGTEIPNGNFKIKKAKIRGVESNGMICAEDELLLSDDHTGIIILDEKLETGKPITEALNLNDVILDIAITPNRPDALSYIGVARDLAALFDRDLKMPELVYSDKGEDVNKEATVIIEDEVNCPRYIAKIVKDVKVKESPKWLKDRLEKIGLRPRNNIVDITNFVLYETGQPLHAFDLDKLSDKKIIIKSTKEETTFTTLDSKERKLPKNTLMICDGKREVAIAGVMGGENSEITESTKNILIESAYFNPSSVRRTSKVLGLSTDASYRFERGADPNITKFAAERCAKLVEQLADGKIVNGLIDVYPKVITPKEIKLRFSRTNKILGYEILPDKIKKILSRLGLAIKVLDDDNLLVSVPTFRPDIEREIDLIEEIARINGYDNIPTVSRINITLEQKHDETEIDEKIRQLATGLGFFEMINNPLQSEEDVKFFGNPIRISNPLSADMEYLRTTLISGALLTVSRNLRQGVKEIKLFEIGNVFNKKTESEIKSFDDFTENQNLIFLISGKEHLKGWNISEKESDIYNLKGIVDSFLLKLSLDNVLIDSYYSTANEIFAYYFSKNYNKVEFDSGGKIKKEVLKQFDINQDVYCFEFNLTELKSLNVQKRRFTEPLKYPKVIRDFAFIFDESVKYLDIKEFIKKKSSQLLKEVTVFDLFESELLGQGKKSIAFTLEYYDYNRTLTEEEVEKDFNNLITLVTKEFNAQLRGK